MRRFIRMMGAQTKAGNMTLSKLDSSPVLSPTARKAFEKAKLRARETLSSSSATKKTKPLASEAIDKALQSQETSEQHSVYG